ncbi:LysR family transcriptional regulator [Herbaspirillum huttiense]|jgi:LysR family transcriptional regulator of beta-lactamase|uniref:LysR family transcriptional regulator n=1 Tax=Herbaspirillum TaxID=963 RepID=UPI001ACFC5A3|nr:MULTISPECIES: LysR family transcriptional regulator [Herbaspirillum]MBN9358667.1 LysR family transcriptional regulator [Herbaspirillum huttiense]MCP3653479.1 LysR family transcriptional regulator [Herbaspirillum sp.]MCP3946890.1 LysR family transcriptional regulator [Herbaspirillum sp.]MCP4031367.1 LysR family transcriptional regulator [Herbaspirillum sp.]MCP4554512.1 LysR family transcriptional regulator [Herbaspirillum sp.]
MYLPLNALRAFEVSARHLSFTRAAEELSVTQTAVSMQVKNLEQRLGVTLFRRLPRGLALTDEGLALLPVVAQSFGRIADVLAQFEDGRRREVLTVGVVGTFAVGWLMPRLREFQQQHPFVDLRLLTNNNRVDLAGEGLDYAIRFGDGAWHGTEAERLFEAPLAPMCAPEIAARLRTPSDLVAETLLRSYRSDEWHRWFAAAAAPCPPLRGFVFDSSLALAEAAAQEAGVALLPVMMFERELRQGRLVCPFEQRIVLGAYWLTRLKSRPQTAAMAAFRTWLKVQADCV